MTKALMDLIHAYAEAHGADMSNVPASDEASTALKAALAQQGEPVVTDEMVAAAIRANAEWAHDGDDDRNPWVVVYRAMLAAAPAPALQAHEDDVSSLSPKGQERARLWLADGTFVSRALGVLRDQEREIVALQKAAAPQAQEPVNGSWHDLYIKEKRRAEMWIAKYEKDIGPLEKAGPVAAQPAQGYKLHSIVISGTGAAGVIGGVSEAN